jgi:hypothetical protein
MVLNYVRKKIKQTPIYYHGRFERKINNKVGLFFLAPGIYVISKVELICKKEKRNHFDLIQLLN